MKKKDYAYDAYEQIHKLSPVQKTSNHDQDTPPQDKNNNENLPDLIDRVDRMDQNISPPDTSADNGSVKSKERSLPKSLPLYQSTNKFDGQFFNAGYELKSEEGSNERNTIKNQTFDIENFRNQREELTQELSRKVSSELSSKISQEFTKKVEDLKQEISKDLDQKLERMFDRMFDRMTEHFVSKKH